MKNLKNLIGLVVLFFTSASSAQNNKLILNDKTVSVLIDEYIAEAKSRGLNIEQRLMDKVDYIIVERGIADESKRKLTGLKMSESNRDKKYIILSESCLNDYLALKGELFKELSYMLGVNYEGQNTIISKDRTKNYTHAYLADPELKQMEFDFMFDKVRSRLN